MAESSTTPADRRETVWRTAYEAVRPSVQDYHGASPYVVAGVTIDALIATGLISLPDTEGVASLRASGAPAKPPRLRRSGSPWTVRVHTWNGDEQTPSHTISNREVPPDSEHHRGHLLPGAEFDELTVGRWLHVEQMGNRTWWMNVGGVTVHVTADRDGRPTKVRVDGPGDYDEPRDGCEYSLEWTGQAAGADPEMRAVLEYVSRGRRFVDVEPYPDALARRVLGRIDVGE